jgi:Flp pilus assembly protein TadD
MTRCRRLPLLLSAVVLLAAPLAQAAGRARWPVPVGQTGALDLLAPVRWESEPAWTSVSPARLEYLLQQIESAPPPARLAASAVLLRGLGRFDDARTALTRAVAADPTVLQDPDVALTHAYLLARAQRYAEAVAAARPVFPQLGGRADARTELALEVARWSMARGADGLAEALAVLRTVTALGPPEPMLRATLALALTRAGRLEEAREIARSGPLPPVSAALAAQQRGSLLPGEGDAAVGVALLLVGRGREAIEPLARAVGRVPAPWRASLDESLASARRAPAPPREEPVCGRDPSGRPLPCSR